MKKKTYHGIQSLTKAFFLQKAKYLVATKHSQELLELQMIVDFGKFNTCSSQFFKHALRFLPKCHNVTEEKIFMTLRLKLGPHQGLNNFKRRKQQVGFFISHYRTPINNIQQVG